LKLSLPSLKRPKITWLVQRRNLKRSRPSKLVLRLNTMDKWLRKMPSRRKQTRPRRKWSRQTDLLTLCKTTKTDGYKMLLNSNH